MTHETGIDLSGIQIQLTEPTPLYRSEDHEVYWLGITEETAFRCNTYLLLDGNEAVLIDPGNRTYFPQIQARVAQILDPRRIAGIILSHQDPDVAASMTDWLAVNPKVRIVSSPRTHVLLPHYGRTDYCAYDVAENPRMALASGGALRFFEAPFLHFPGAFASYDERSGFLFSGDIWAALDMDWSLTVESFEEHVPMMDLFHVDYMASNIAARGFVERLTGTPIEAILPQHGSIITARHVDPALDYLRNLRCGTDIIYPHLRS